MTKYIVEGGRPLFGEIPISGAKNAAVAIIPAALMVSGPCRIENMPQISDVTLLLGILQDLGAKVRYVNPHTVEIDSSGLRNNRVPYESARRCRAPTICWVRCWAGLAWRTYRCPAGVILAAPGPLTSI